MSYVTIIPGENYIFTLVTGKEINIVVRGVRVSPNGQQYLVIEVNGVSGEYPELKDALGDAYVKVKKA